MLSSLQANRKNVAVIQKATSVHFEKGLNVLTGETGAGKSILIDSIQCPLRATAPPRIWCARGLQKQSSGRHLMMLHLQCWTAWKRQDMSAQKR